MPNFTIRTNTHRTMKRRTFPLSTLLILSILFLSYKPLIAQDSTTVVADPSLNGQYQDLLRRSWTQQGYKVINPTRLSTLWRNVQDSLRSERRKLPSIQSQLIKQEKTITDLKKEISTYQENLEKSEASVNSVQFLGMSVEKSTYNTIMWGAVIILAAAFAVSLFTAGKSVREAKYRRQLYDELAAEHQTYKTKANEKEKKLARELQTERNKVEELMGRDH